MVVHTDMTSDEWKWLVRLCQHEADSIPKEIEARFTALGLLGPNGLSDNARNLVQNELLAERRNRLQGLH
ncbi:MULTISPECIES: hypothetical protein [unclassified Rhizobium]|uniref:hypothetical protein n=1 Tax=unclassified Rhizobium TaxID=2613769 RepID=UPI0007EB97BB|nr:MULTISPECIES: hypothetical protein [unclassified Rhizobium]ANM11505.1 hypothetical protein AMK05_CH03142 [Rhizobium sp. N324]ANM17978.1 hypothetical protein AMK06_CH03099 [Rhizobium sp. N541]ANM24364.1 hypothetical protein AMK07_CH03097 [Rhizobium sp. N941]OYD05110.1 hypothetical protein AMK08_CH103161 [Rhizobium sp. N4311]